MSEVTALQFDLIPPSDDQFRELVADLGDEERHVLLEHGTEAPFCGIFLDEKQPGVYTCRLCGLPLFKGGAKFESGTGWPSFTAPFAEDHLRTIRDTSYGMTRPEIVRSEEHTSELQSLMRISYAVFCLKKKNTTYNNHRQTLITTYN